MLHLTSVYHSNQGAAETATGCDYHVSAQHLVQNWKNSPAHNKALLNSTNIGAGSFVDMDSNGHRFAIMNFGDRWE